MPANAFTQWQNNTPFEVGTAGAVQHGDLTPFFRDSLDAYRSAWNRTPEAQYPDGYLGTIRTRREDRMLGAVSERSTQRNYQRGVHKGERIDQSDYFWRPDFNPMSGLQRQATTGMRAAPLFGPETTVLAHDGKVSGAMLGVISVNPAEAQKLSHLRPRWS